MNKNNTPKMPLAMRRYFVRLAICMILYAVTLVAVITAFNNDALSGGSAYFAGILPAFPIMGMFWAIGKLLSETHDEYRRLLFTRQILVASGFALSIATGWGFLEEFKLVFHISAYYWSVLWFLGLFVGMAFNKITLGDV